MAGARDLVLALVMKFTIVCIQTELILIFNFLQRCGYEGELSLQLLGEKQLAPSL